MLVLGAGTGFLLGVCLGVIALSCARAAARKMSAGQPGRPGQVKAAQRIGVVTIALSVVAMVVWSILTANGYSPQDFQQDVMDELDRMRSR